METIEEKKAIAQQPERASARKLADRAIEAVTALKDHVHTLESDVQAVVSELNRYLAIDIEEVKKFLKEPWLILPKSRDEWWVLIPRWVGLSVGWLQQSTDTYNCFVVNRYSMWFTEIPGDLKSKLKLPEPFEASVEEGRLKTTLAVAEKFGQHLWGQTGANEFRIRKGHEFHLMAALIDAGTLPFRPKPVEPSDLREIKPTGVLANLYEYQKSAWQKLLQYGAVGVYWPWGQGKTVLGIYAIANIKGPKLIVVPTVILKEQWEDELQKKLDLKLRTDVEIITYHSWERVQQNQYALIIFDEAHRLPANKFSRLASVRTKYRLGLSATPNREDGREPYIMALTGFPIGVDWGEFVRSGKIKPPDIEVRIVKKWENKVAITATEAKDVKGMTVVFCDGIDKGAEVARRLKCPHVHGETQNRLETLRSTDVAVVSRVGDEGLSLPNLRKVIEVDFHGSSRRQEGQRVGRLLHADKKGEHIVLMTQDEFDKFENRFLALEEKGFRIRVRTV